MLYRTRTYIAGDWTGDADLINKLYEWNSNNYWALSFSDAHSLTQARDTSLPCSIKHSLAERLNGSRTFVLIVGDQTADLRKGGCQYCYSYNSHTYSCARGHSTDYKSFIEFECEKAVRDNLKIVVIYNSSYVDRSKCPEKIRYIGTHIAAKKPYTYLWDYDSIKTAIV